MTFNCKKVLLVIKAAAMMKLSQQIFIELTQNQIVR